MKKYFYLLISLTVLLGINSITQAQSENLTIDKAIQLALTNQPLIKQAEDEISIVIAGIHEGESYYSPVVSANVTDFMMGPISQVAFGPEIFKFLPDNNFDAKIQVGYLLYDFNKRDATLDVLKSYKLTAEEKVNIIKNELAYKTVQAFYSILYLEKSKQVKEEQIQTLKKHIEDAQKRVDSGAAIDLDVLTTKVRVASAENQLIDINKNLEKSKVAMRALLGLNSDVQIKLTGDFDSAVNINSENELLQNAFLNREEIKIAQLNEKSNQLQKRTAELSEMPALNLFGSYGLKNGFEPNLDAYRGNWVLGAEISVPIFNGGKKDALIEGADAKIKAANDNIESLKRKIKMEVEQSMVDLKSSTEKLNAVKIQIEQAEQALNKAKIQYDNGVIKNLDLLDAETSLTETKLQYFSSAYQITTNEYLLKQSIGEKIW